MEGGGGETKMKIPVYEPIIVALWSKILLQKNQNALPSLFLSLLLVAPLVLFYHI